MSKRSFVKGLSLILALLMLCSAATLCITANPTQTTSTSNQANMLDLSTYCIVRPDNASSDLVYAAALLRAHIEQYTGVKIELKDDSSAEQANEILIGTTNRSSAASLYNATKGENWAVKQIGSKVVLSAGDLCDIVNATNWFVENCISKNSKNMAIGEGYSTNNALPSYITSGFKIGSVTVTNELKVTYISGDEVGFIDTAILLADNIRRLSGITPTVTAYSDSASNQILVASSANVGSYATALSETNKFSITKRGNNIIITSPDSMGAEMGVQKIVEAMQSANGNIVDLSALVGTHTYNYKNALNLEIGAEYRIMSYNIERMELNTADRSELHLNNILFYNPDVVGFQEFCVDLKAKLRTKFANNGYTLVEPVPEKYNNTDTSCADRYSFTNNYTPIAYKTEKFDLLESGAKRIIPSKTSGNSIQGSYGWPGYTCTWAVLKDKTTGEVFAVTALHNKTGGTNSDQEKKIVSLGIVKNIADTIKNIYSCPVFMVGDYNSQDTYKDINSFANAENGIYNARNLAEHGYSACASHHDGKTPTTAGSLIDHIFVTGNARVLRHRHAMDSKVFQAADHKPIFVDVIVGEKGTAYNSAAIFSGHGSSLVINKTNYLHVENVIEDFFAGAGPLAITEIMPAPQNAEYEYIEIKNTGSFSVDVSEYYLYRFGFSNGGEHINLASGVNKVFGLSSSIDNLVKVSLANIIGDKKTLAPGEIAVIWIQSVASKNKNASYFENNWGLKSGDVTILTLKVHNASSNLYPATNINSNAGNGFLPDANAGIALSLIHKDSNIKGDTPANDDTTNHRTAEYTRARHAAADCSVLLLTDDHNANASTLIKNKAANYYDFVDIQKFNKAAEEVTYSEKITDVYSTVGLIPEGLLVDKRTADDKETLKAIENTNTSSLCAVPFVNVAIKDTATPGTLVDGQFGSETQSSVVVEGVQTKKNANNTADLRFVASLKGSYLNYRSAGFEFTLNGQTATVNCKYVYKTLNSNAGVISPEEYGADYFFCYSLKNVSAGTYTFSIRSWSLEDGASEKVYSQTKTVTFIVASDGSVTIN